MNMDIYNAASRGDLEAVRAAIRRRGDVDYSSLVS